MITATISITAADEAALALALYQAARAILDERKPYTMDSDERWAMTAVRHGEAEKKA